MRVLFLFLDGVGLGEDNPQINPLVAANLPVLSSLLEGRKLVASSAPMVNGRASLFALDASMGVDGLPQSATGQAVLFTGRNIPASLGEHYGPKPNPQIIEQIQRGTLLNRLLAANKRAALLNAFPPGYFQAIESGRRLPGAIAMSFRMAGIPLRTHEDYVAGQALSADFLGVAWRERLGLQGAPLYSAAEAGQQLAALSAGLDLAVFEYWLSDVAGHGQAMDEAISLLETLDSVIGGLLQAWDDEAGLILITSDHGNLEDLSTRKHTANRVPALLIGAPHLRQRFSQNLNTLQDITPAIEDLLLQ